MDQSETWRVAGCRGEAAHNAIRPNTRTASQRSFIQPQTDKRVFPESLGTLSSLFNQFKIFRILEPLSNCLLHDSLGFESMLLAVLIQQALELTVDSMG